MLVLLLFACSDYEIKEKSVDPDPGTSTPGAPEIEVTPASVDLGAVCGGGDLTAMVRNVGDAALDVREVAVAGDGWSIVGSPAPFTLGPGEQQGLDLHGTGGDGTLTVVSTDADEGVLDVPLHAEVDLPPTVVWADPAPGTVLPVTGVTTLRAQVADDVDAPETLQVTWSSDVDGPLGTAPAGADGVATLAWDASAHTPGTHTLTVSVVDSCGGTDTTEVAFCQDLGYDVETLDLATWHFEGSALYDAANGWVQLTAPIANQAGTAFQTVSTVSADNVAIDFAFFVSGGTGADGISVTALDSDRMSGFVGSTGGGIGYAGLPGWAIEVDTWYNAELGDPTTEDHVSFHLDGDYTVIQWAPLPEMEDGAWHQMSVLTAGDHVTASIDGTVYLDFDSPRSLAFPAYVGFTGATGSYTNFHLVDGLVVTESVCEDGG